MKKRWTLLFLSLCLSFLFSVPVRAEEGETLLEEGLSLTEELDFTEIQSAVDEVLEGDFQFKSIVLELISGKQPFTLKGFLETALAQTGSFWRAEKHILLTILVIGIASALFSGFTDVFQSQQTGEVSFEIAYMLLFMLLLQVFEGAAVLTEELILSLREFMKALIPAYCLAVTMASTAATGAVFYQFLLGLIYVLEWLIQTGLLGMIRIYVILSFLSSLTPEAYLSQMTELIGKAAGWILKSVLAVVAGFHMIRGMLSPAVDALKNTALSRAAEMIPGIGNIAGSVTDILLGSAVLIKNGIGAAALLVIFFICMAPLLKLGVLALLLELAAALIQPVCDKRMTACVAGAGAGIRLLFRAAFTVAVLFILTIVVVTVSVRSGV